MKQKQYENLLILLWVGGTIIIGSWIGYGIPFSGSCIGVLILIGLTMLGSIVADLVPIKALPPVFWISLLALLFTSPLNPYGEMIATKYLTQINFMAIATPILAYAGLALGKDLKLFKTLSWKIIIVALAVYTGTFVFATLIAQGVMTITGII